MSSYVPNLNTPTSRMKEAYLDHIVNKACYSYIHGYDFIFNTTYGFDSTYPKWHWLVDFGHWNKVPHVEARIREYDWILYADTDIVIKDLTKPLESFLYQFELYGKKNVHLFVPADYAAKDVFTFSNFAFMIRNSAFGHSILKHWDTFARGICPRGNLNLSKADQKYTWLDSDQPGLWYAMMRAYGDNFPDRVPNNNYPQCNTTTGVLDKHTPPWNDFFLAMVNLTKGSTGSQLDEVPEDQPIVWSGFVPEEAHSGLGLQLNWGKKPSNEGYMSGAFALHQKNASAFPKSTLLELLHCRRNLGCYAHYDQAGELKIGCGDKIYL